MYTGVSPLVNWSSVAGTFIRGGKGKGGFSTGQLVFLNVLQLVYVCMVVSLASWSSERIAAGICMYGGLSGQLVF